MLFLRICLFAAYESCFETMFTQLGALWLILIAAAFGLRFLAVVAGLAAKRRAERCQTLKPNFQLTFIFRGLAPNYGARGAQAPCRHKPALFALTAPAEPKWDVPVATIGGLPIAVIDRARSAALMVDTALARRDTAQRPLVFTSANGQVLSMCARDARIRDLFLDADLIHADGMPLVFVSRLLGKTPLPERVATTDLFHDTAIVAQQRGASIYLLGATKSVVDQAVRRTRELYPNLKIAGYSSGYLRRDGDEERIIADINHAQPDILWLGLGAPAEQSFAARNRDRLRGVGLIKTSGGLFDFVSGKNTRAPAWMQRLGLEWAYRIYLEPRRLAGRYLMTNPHAIFLLLTRTAQSRERAADTKRLRAMTELPAPHVCLCVPTFRRPDGLRKLLAHVERLTYAGPIDVVVVDNDAEGRAGAAVVEEIARTFRLPLTCLVEPRRGHTYAYNRAFAQLAARRRRPITWPCSTTTNIPTRTGSRK